ncbi:SIS domain-containing protein [Bdellovibrionota bacterium]
MLESGPMGNLSEIQSFFDESIRVKQEVARLLARDIDQVVKVLENSLRAGKKALFFGNGGSAADAQHLAAELVGRFRLDRSPLPAIALTTDTSVLTSVGNDYGFEEVFSRQLEALGNTGDIAFGITTSGKSPNIIKAFEVAREQGLVTVGLTGGDGGVVAGLVDYHLNVSCSKDTAHIQEAHITIGHVIMELVEKALGISESKPESYNRQLEI